MGLQGCPIQDVFAGGEDDLTCFSPEVWRVLKTGEEDSLVRITTCRGLSALAIEQQEASVT